jgi:hypothetical protein
MEDRNIVKCDAKTLDYAWNWFEYHARQRITAFNLFLVLVGAIVAGLLKCAEIAEKASIPVIAEDNVRQTWWFLSFIISIFGVLISIAFWFIDIRNAELVNCGREALMDLEVSLGLKIRQDDVERKYLDKSLDILSRQIPRSWLSKLIRHGTWLRTIMIFAAFIFLISALYALWEMFAAGDHSVFCINTPIHNIFAILSK